MRTKTQQKRYDNLPESVKLMITENKRLDKCTIGLRFPAWHVANIYWDKFKRDELVEKFNEYFGTNMK